MATTMAKQKFPPQLFTEAEMSNPRFRYDPARTERLIDNFLSLALNPPEHHYDAIAQIENDRQLELLAQQIAQDEKQRQKLWGNRYPKRLGDRPTGKPGNTQKGKEKEKG